MMLKRPIKRERPCADPRIEALIDDVGRQVRRRRRRYGSRRRRSRRSAADSSDARRPPRAPVPKCLLAYRLPFGARPARQARWRERGSQASPRRGSRAPRAQPKLWISACPKGAKTNCPIEPAAVPMPKTIERFSGGTRRPKAASTMEKDAAAMPRPIISAGGDIEPERVRRPRHQDKARRIDETAAREHAARP